MVSTDRCRLAGLRAGRGLSASDHPKTDSVGGRAGRQSYFMVSPDRLRLAMELLGDLTQGELARASGVSTTTISLVLAGKRDLRPAMEVKLIEGLERAFRQNGARLDTAFFEPARCRAPGVDENRPPSG